MATTYVVDLDDIEEKGSILAADFINAEGEKAALQKKETYVPLTPEEVFQQRAKAFCQSDYRSFTKQAVEPLAAKLEKLTAPQKADIEARLKAYVPDTIKAEAVVEDVK
jgi:hypothetical protein